MLRIHNNINEIFLNDQALFLLVTEIDNIVETCAQRAYNISSLVTSYPKQKAWYKAVKDYFNNGGTNLDSLFYAKYGYAVEDMVNIQLRAQYCGSVNGYRVSLQVNYVDTIPDIVISKTNGKDIAWLDITSYASAGHINDKNSDKWSTIPFVAELLYPKFSITELRDSNERGIGSRALALKMSRQNDNFDRKLQEFLGDRVLLAFKAMQEPLRKKTIAECIENAFGQRLPAWGKHMLVKSILLEYIKNNANEYGVQTAKEILRKFYINISQNKSLAMRYVADCYEKYKHQKLRTNSIFNSSYIDSDYDEE